MNSFAPSISIGSSSRGVIPSIEYPIPQIPLTNITNKVINPPPFHLRGRTGSGETGLPPSFAALFPWNAGGDAAGAGARVGGYGQTVELDIAFARSRDRMRVRRVRAVCGRFMACAPRKPRTTVARRISRGDGTGAREPSLSARRSRRNRAEPGAPRTSAHRPFAEKQSPPACPFHAHAPGAAPAARFSNFLRRKVRVRRRMISCVRPLPRRQKGAQPAFARSI